MNPFRAKFELFVVRAIEALFRMLPLRASRAVGAGLGALVGALGIRKKVALEQLAFALPELSDAERLHIANGMYRSFGRTLAEFARLPLLTPENISSQMEFHGLDVMRAAIAEGKGIIGVSGHLGNWEWMGAGTALSGIPLTYIVASQSNKLVEERMDTLRKGCGIEIVNRNDNAAKGTLRALRNGRLVAILCDQDAHSEGVFVPFFGRLASTPRGAMVFALRTGAPVIFNEGVRIGQNFQMTYERMDLSGLPEEHEAAVTEGMKRITARLEQSIRAHHEQWLWLHRRWKTRPEIKETPTPNSREGKPVDVRLFN